MQCFGDFEDAGKCHGGSNSRFFVFFLKLGLVRLIATILDPFLAK